MSPADRSYRKKRHRGEGSIYQRATDNRWVGVIDLGRVGGKRVRKTVTAATEAKARAKFDKLKSELLAGDTCPRCGYQWPDDGDGVPT